MLTGDLQRFDEAIKTFNLCSGVEAPLNIKDYTASQNRKGREMQDAPINYESRTEAHIFRPYHRAAVP